MPQNVEIRLRAPEPDDVDSIYAWENDGPETAPAPVSRFKVWEYVQNYNPEPLRSGEARLVVTDTASGDKVGCVDLFMVDACNRHAGVGIYIAPAKRRLGYGCAALAGVEDFARRLGLHQLWAHIAAGNTASRALFANAGFRPAGRLRSWIRRGNTYEDVMIVQKLLP